MKKNETKTNYVDLNTVMLSGTISFNTKVADGVCNVGIKCNYHNEIVNKDFTTYPVVKLFSTDNVNVEDIEKGDCITLKGHYTTRKYNDKYYTELIADSFEIV